MTDDKTITITVVLPEHLAMPLAQFLKRITYSGVRECAVDENEAYAILEGLTNVQEALSDKGYSPR